LGRLIILNKDMQKIEEYIKGGVIIIGSLRWESEQNAIEEKASKDLAIKREQWRNTNLDLENEERHKLPIKYGRCSSTRRCTYTMVFSNLALKKESYGLVVPYKKEIDFNNYENFERQALLLAEVEDIFKGDNRLRREWGCIGLHINPKSNHNHKIKEHWEKLKLIDNEYNKSSKQYRIGNNDLSLLNSDYTLSLDCLIKTDLDFLFFTYIRPQHRDSTIKVFPTPKEIADEIIRSGYKTYFEENRKCGIITFEDEEIKGYLI
jgi:hypothetical protein